MPFLEYFLVILTVACIYAIFCFGLNLQWGYTGLINIGHVAFLAVGAYTSARLTLPAPWGLGAPFPVGLLAGMVLAGIFAYLIGIPTLRLRKDYLAIVTLGFAEILRLIILNEMWLTNGPIGLPGIPQPLRGLIPRYDVFYFILVLSALIIIYLFLERITNSPWGRVLKAIREDEDVAKALGKDVTGYKMQSLVLGSAIAGGAGSLLAHFFTYISPDLFDHMQTFYAWIVVVLGGSGNNKGTVLGAFLITAFLEGTRFLKDFFPIAIGPDRIAAIRLVVVGILLIVLMMRRPEGILGEKKFVSELLEMK
ncbi:MAG: branched-chain amino acid ABC transporter permease [Candidatus Hydrothermarchaeota archaeon]